MPSLLQPVANSKPSSVAAITTFAGRFTSPWSASALELARANKIDSRVPWAITAVSFPVMAFKQFVNVVQLIKASSWLAEGDRAQRRSKKA